MNAILFWDGFEVRWLRGSESHYPERPKDLPSMKPLGICTQGPPTTIS
jgi:hypothetical protein